MRKQRKAGSTEPVPARAATRTRISQQDVPSFSLEDALRIPKAIADNYGFKPSSPLQVARALGMQPSTGTFRMLAGAAVAYGLTSGGYGVDQISIEPLGLRIVRATAEGDDLKAKREALLRPRVVREFLTRYDRASLPSPEIAQNVLIDMGVPQDRTHQVFEMILECAQFGGFIQEIKGRKYVELGSTPVTTVSAVQEDAEKTAGEPEPQTSPQPPTGLPPQEGGQRDPRLKRVFITHGKNKSFIDPIKKLLVFGQLDAVVAVERESVSQPVTDKVMNDMRSCGAAIIHVEDELRLMDKDANEHIVLNPNVLIEIGAAMALYGRRFILLVKEGVKLPSNLQGLFEVRYGGDTLSGDTTIKLLEAINDIKNHPLPGPASR